MTTKRTFWISAVLLVPTLVALALIDVELRTAHAPLGIISFEFCGFANSCSAVLEEWSGSHSELAMLSLGLDYLFMLSYASMLWAGLMWSSERLESRARVLVRAVAAGALLAGLADAAENYCLIQIVRGGSVQVHGMLASTFATVKFALVSIALLTWASLGLRRGIGYLLAPGGGPSDREG